MNNWQTWKIWSFFEKLTQAFPTIDNNAPPNKLLSFYLYYLRGYKKHLFLITILKASEAIVDVMLFAFLGQLVNWLALHDKTTFLAAEGGTLLTMALVILVVLPLLVISSSLLNYQGLMGNFPMSIRWRMHRHLLGQSMSFYQDEFSGRIATKVMQTALAVRQSITALLGVLVYVVVSFASMLILLSQLHPLFVLPLLFWFISYALIQWYFVPRLRNIAHRQADARSTMTGRIVDAYTNIATVKLFAHTKREADYARDSMGDFLTTVHLQFRLVTALNFCVNMINYLLLFLICALGIKLWLQDVLAVGGIATGGVLALRLSGMSHWIMFEISGFFENIGTTMDGMNMLAKPQKVRDDNDAGQLAIKTGEIIFDEVCFSYRPAPKNDDCDKQQIDLQVIKNFNLHIQGGEKIGLVGRSGAGKSTLVNLLLRFYDVEGGRILIDGNDICRVTQDSLRQQIAMVTQDTSLLHRTIGENILYGRPNASVEQLQAAINGAKVSEFIHELSDRSGNTGIDAQVGERGVKLSGGQRQRIAIARVLLKDAPILILDEATSALDSEIEAAIQETLWQLMEGKTVIAIAHRLSTIAAMDRLVVMDKGQIVEQGTHEQLLALKGIYARLWSRQTGGYLGDDDLQS